MAKSSTNTKQSTTKANGRVSAAKKPIAAKSAISVKCGRNADGTFAAGNTIGVGYGGRPKEALSFRDQVKIRAAKDPKMVQSAIDTLVKIANDPEHPKCVEAIDKLIKLNGNYDPQETKDVTPKEIPEDPLFNLTVDELRTLKALKKGKK